MPASSSSPGPGATIAVWLYDNAVPGNRQFFVNVAVPLPPLVLYLGTYYVWDNVKGYYEQVTAYSATLAALTAPAASAVALPQFNQF